MLLFKRNHTNLLKSALATGTSLSSTDEAKAVVLKLNIKHKVKNGCFKEGISQLTGHKNIVPDVTTRTVLHPQYEESVVHLVCLYPTKFYNYVSTPVLTLSHLKYHNLEFHKSLSAFPC